MSISCTEVEPMIGFLLDSELDPDQSEEVHAHLEECESCQSILEEEGNLRDVLRRAAASIDTPVALRNRIKLAMERERRSQVGIARAWPAAVAAAILVSFVWHGQNTPVRQTSNTLSQAHARLVPMDIVSDDPQVVAHFLRTQLAYVVPIHSIATSLTDAKPQQLAARVIEQDGRQSALLRVEYGAGSMSFIISHADPANNRATAEFGTKAAANAVHAHRLYLAQDARGVTVAQWQNQGLVYDMVSDLPHDRVAESVHRLAR